MIDGVHIWRAHLEGPSWPLLRRVLGYYLEGEPREDDLVVSEGGKPALRDGNGLEFNLSHSRNLALVAVAERPVGIDVEAIRPGRDVERLAERFLDAAAAAEVREAAGDERERAFYRAWTRHEARLKCLGTGLGLAKLQSSTASTPELHQLVYPADRKVDAVPPLGRLALENVEVASGFAAAVAIRGAEVGPVERRSL